MRRSILLLLPFLLAADAPRGYVIDSKEARKIEASLTFGVRHDGIKADEWVVFVAQCPELPGQPHARTRTDLNATAVKLGAPEQRRTLLRARLPAKTPEQQKGYEIRTTIEAALNARKLRPLAADEAAPKVADLGPKERKLFLASVGDLNYEAPLFRSWLKDNALVRAKDEGEIDYARRVFQVIRGKFKYEIKGEMDRSALGACKAGASDCSGLSAVFCAALRAEGIPARMLFGRWAQSSPADNSNNKTHVKAEFFVRGVGWVPVDAAAGLVYDRSKEGLKYFGDDPGDFVTFHLDDGFELDTLIVGKQKVHNLQAPSGWVTGKSGSGAPKFKDEWRVADAKP